MTSPIATAIQQICNEKGVSKEAVLETIESALAAAYRKDFGNKLQNIKVTFDIETGQSHVFDVKTVVEDLPEEERDLWLKGEWPPKPEEGVELEEKKPTDKDAKKKDGAEGREDKKQKDGDNKEGAGEEDEEEKKRFNPKTEIQITDAQDIQKDIALGEELIVALEVPDTYGRMAAQTAKQVIIQKIREAERATIYEDFKDKEHTLITGVVHRRDARGIIVDLGRANGVLPYEQQIPGERYTQGSRIKAYITSIEVTPKGPQILLSRTHTDIIRELFATEIPEVNSEAILIRDIAREPGARSKVAVESTQDTIDPIGSCVGQRGSRIQTIISELGGEKIDIIEYNEDPAVYLTNALSPAKVEKVEINVEEKTARAIVREDQLSLAIGRDGQNVRLAAQLTGWKVNIVGEDGKVVENAGEESSENEQENQGAEEQKQDKASEVKEGKEEEKELSKKKGTAQSEVAEKASDEEIVVDEKEVADELEKVKKEKAEKKSSAKKKEQ